MISNVKLKCKLNKGNPAYLSGKKVLDEVVADGVAGWIDIHWGAGELVERTGGIGAWFGFYL